MNDLEIVDEFKNEYIAIKEWLAINHDDAVCTDLDLSDSKLTPHILKIIVMKLGYVVADESVNGWERDLFYTFAQKATESFYLRICSYSTTYELYLMKKY